MFILIPALIGMACLFFLIQRPSGDATSNIPSPPTFAERPAQTGEALGLADERQRVDTTSVKIPENHVVVRVIDQQSRPIPSAVVAVLASPRSGVEMHTAADKGGNALLPEALTYPCELIVSCEGYVSRAVYLSTQPSEPLVIVLDASCTIYGQVVGSQSKLPVPGAQVMLWPSALRRPPLDLLTHGPDKLASVVSVVKCDEQGRFEAGGLSCRSNYCGIAATKNLASRSVKTDISAVAASNTLELESLYALRIALKTPDPAAQQSVSIMMPPIMDPIQDNFPDVSYVYQPSYIPMLSGLATQLQYGSIADNTYLFVGDATVAALGPVEYSLSVTGFEPVHEQILIPKVIDSIAVHEIVLRPISGGMTRCQVNFALPDALKSQPNSIYSPFSKLVFSRQNAPTQERTEVAVSSSLTDSLSVDLPYGTYEVRYISDSTGTSSPDEDSPPLIVDLNSSTAHLTIDLKNTGGIDLHVKDDSGLESSGVLTVSLSRTLRNGVMVTSTASMRGAPYFLVPVRPGDYSIHSLGHSVFINQVGSGTANVRSGKMTSVDLRVSKY